MKILAIDPGSEQSAFVLWDTEQHCFTGEGKGILNNYDLLAALPDIAFPANFGAIEMIQSYGFGVGRTTFQTCVWIGKFMHALDLQDWEGLALYGRPTIKGQIGGKNDAEIRASLRLRYGEARKGELLEGVKKDIWAALALAVALEENPNLKEW